MACISFNMYNKTQYHKWVKSFLNEHSYSNEPAFLRNIYEGFTQKISSEGRIHEKRGKNSRKIGRPIFAPLPCLILSNFVQFCPILLEIGHHLWTIPYLNFALLYTC